MIDLVQTRRFLILIMVLCAGVAQAHDFQLAPRLPTGLFLEPAGRSFDVGNMPLSVAVSPEGKLILLLSGYREQGVQVFNPASGKVEQSLAQPSAFLGLVFSSDGKRLYVSGGNEDAVYIYRWQQGVAEPAGTLPLGTAKNGGKGTRYPAGLALSKNNRYLYVAENLSDTLAVIELKTGSVVQRQPAGGYPYGVVVAADGAVYVSAWGEGIVSRFRTDSSGKLRKRDTLSVVRHPSGLLLNRDSSRLFVASASTDRIAVLDTKRFRLINTLQDAPPGTGEGSTPNALALSADQKRLYVAEADNNSVAVFDLSASSSGVSHAKGDDRLIGRIPVGWYPVALVFLRDHLYVVNGKGSGTRANPGASQVRPYADTPEEYTLGMLNGTITQLPAEMPAEELEAESKRVAELNGWNVAAEAEASYPPFKHVMYIIKENRTYDQVLGDLPQGDGDSSLVIFPRRVSPNHHALAERFGLFDRFFVNAEVSAQGHPWSTSAYVTDFTEKTVSSDYSGRRPELPDDEASDPASGYLWDLAIKGNISLRVYGEKAEPAPDEKTYRSTKSGLSEYTSPIYPSYNMDIPDQTRVDAWLSEFNEFVKSGRMPLLQIFHLPGDHTAGALAGLPTPAACVADNDLALGRMIEALSASSFWSDTVVFVLEDDSQSGPDHVDSHRSVLLVVSPYNRGGGVFSRFVNTTDIVATIEEILGLGSLSQFDHYGRPLREIFSAEPDLQPYQALIPEQPLTDRNPQGENAKNSLRLKLDKEDASDDELFNRILWAAIRGDDVPFPEPRRIPLLEIQQGQ